MLNFFILDVPNGSGLWGMKDMFGSPPVSVLRYLKADVVLPTEIHREQVNSDLQISLNWSTMPKN